MTYTEALDKFVETIKVNSNKHYKEKGMTFLIDNPSEAVKVNKGRRFDKVVREHQFTVLLKKNQVISLKQLVGELLS